MVTNVSMVLSAVYTHSCVCVYLVYVVLGWKGSRGENQCVWMYITVNMCAYTHSFIELQVYIPLKGIIATSMVFCICGW